MERIVNYHNLMKSFLDDSKNSKFQQFFHGFHITLVCDELALSWPLQAAFDGYLASGALTHFSWRNFLLRTKVVHKDFLGEADRQKSLVVRGS